jgi:hypothetical protein
MKKLIALTIASVMLLASLASCQTVQKDDSNKPPKQDATVPAASLKGAEAAKLLLAEERLNAKLLQNQGDIFENGAEVFDNLAAIAKENLVKYTPQSPTVTQLSFDASGRGGVQTLGAGGRAHTENLSTVIPSSDGSVLEIDGDLYKWSGFAEYSNSYDYFTNLTNCVVSSANSAAEQINNTKKHVRVIDKWVRVGSIEYYLHVEDNCEILYERWDGGFSICKRTKDEQGVNVYELYRSSDNTQTRMTYIQGRKYEYTHRNPDGFNHNFIAENTKGFWEVVDVGRHESHYNVSCMVVKDDICYDAFYDPAEERRGLSMIKFISADKKTDILFTNSEGSSMELSLQAFDGVKHIQLRAPADKVGPTFDPDGNYSMYYLEQDGQKYYFTTGAESADVVLENGMTLRDGDEYLDGKVQVSRTLVTFFNKENGTCGYMPQLSLIIRGSDFEERMALLAEFLELTGLTCRRDMTEVQAGILQACEELSQFVQYQQWNESPIATEEDLARGFENLDAKYNTWDDLYATVKDGEVIDINDTEAMELNIHFAPITAQQAATVQNEGLAITVTDLSLTIEDTALMIEDEPYMVNFALVGKSSAGLTHIPVEGSKTVAYTGGSPFTVTQSARFEIPALYFDEYTVVAYISTADGIRMSGYTPLIFTEVAEYESRAENIAVTVRAGDNGALAVICERILDIRVDLTFEGDTVSYAAMYNALAERVYLYGYVAEGAELEMLAEDGTWTEVEHSASKPAEGESDTTDTTETTEPAIHGTESEDARPEPDKEEQHPEAEIILKSGTYRLRYEIKNGDSLIEGFVYTEYGA